MKPAEKAISVGILLIITVLLVKNYSVTKKMNALIAKNNTELEVPKIKQK